MKLKLSVWSDFMFIATALFVVFCLIIYCVPVNVQLLGQGKFSWMKVEEITLAQFWSMTNTALKGFKFTFMIVGIGAACAIIDLVFTRPFLFRFTKAHKVAKAKLDKEYKELKNEKQ